VARGSFCAGRRNQAEPVDGEEEIHHRQPVAAGLPDAPARRALLLYGFNGIRAKFARFVFHLWVLFTILIIVATVVTTFEDPRALPSNVIAMVAWLGWAVGLRYWAVTLDGRTKT
jgi:hypothetical protein